MSKQVRKPRHSLIPYVTIQAASQGDADAINTVLRHYEGYIARLFSAPYARLLRLYPFAGR